MTSDDQADHRAVYFLGSDVMANEYDIYHRLAVWPGFRTGEPGGLTLRYVKLDGDGHHEVHVDTMGGCRSLLRSWLRPRRGISQERLPLYLYVGFFQFVYPVRRTIAKCKLGKLRSSFRVQREISPNRWSGNSRSLGKGEIFLALRFSRNDNLIGTLQSSWG